MTTLSLEQIDVGERLRAVDEDYARLLAEGFRESGQITPIDVRRSGDRYLLIAGAHRVRAAQLLGWAEIEATVREVDDLGAEMMQIDENLLRHDLTEMDRATFLARRKELYEQLHPAAKHGGKRRGTSRQNWQLDRRFTSEAAERLRISERSVQRAVRRHARLAPDVRGLLARTRFADHGQSLDALARLTADEQRRVVRMLTAPEHPLPTVAAAVAKLRGTPPKAAPDKFQQFERLWRGMDRVTRARVRALVNRKSEQEDDQ